MKKPLLIVLAVLGALPLYGQWIVEDRNSRWQRERMAYQRWDKFRPKWYFVLNHNRYRKGPDRRTVKQLYPALATMELNVEESQEEREKAAQWEGHHLAQQANVLAEKHYWLRFKPELDSYRNQFYALALPLETAPPGVMQPLYDEAAMLDEYLAITREGNSNPGESQAAMAEIASGWQRLIAVVSRLSRGYRPTLGKEAAR